MGLDDGSLKGDEFCPEMNIMRIIILRKLFFIDQYFSNFTHSWGNVKFVDLQKLKVYPCTISDWRKMKNKTYFSTIGKSPSLFKQRLSDYKHVDIFVTIYMYLLFPYYSSKDVHDDSV